MLPIFLFICRPFVEHFNVYLFSILLFVAHLYFRFTNFCLFIGHFYAFLSRIYHIYVANYLLSMYRLFLSVSASLSIIFNICSFLRVLQVFDYCCLFTSNLITTASTIYYVHFCLFLYF